MASMEAHGPNTMAAIPTPTACPVVPPGKGRLNIITTNENAANTETNGIRREPIFRATRRSATHQNGAEPAYRAAQVAGLR